MKTSIYRCANGHEKDNPGLCTRILESGATCGMFPRLVITEEEITEKERRVESHSYTLACFEHTISHKGRKYAISEIDYRCCDAASPEFKLALDALIAMIDEDYPNKRIGNWIVKIHAGNRGYFENQRTGCSGMLIFDGKKLDDYDGVYELPKLVIQALRELGYTVDAITANENPQHFCYECSQYFDSDEKLASHTCSIICPICHKPDYCIHCDN